MTFVDISELIRPQPTGEPGRFVLDVPAGVSQGKGAWGGVAAGAITSAAIQTADDPALDVRNVTAQLIGAILPGRKSMTVETLRRGRGTLTVSVRLVDEHSEVQAHGVVVLGTRRPGADLPDGPEWLSVTPPAALAAGPHAVPVAPVGPPMAPEFISQVEIRPLGAPPFSGDTGTDVVGWLSPRGAITRVDAALVAALADTWWVTVMPRLSRPRPVGTLTYSLDLPGDPRWLIVGRDGRLEPILHRSTLIAAREGFTVETRELWTADGRLLSWNTQTVAVIK